MISQVCPNEIRTQNRKLLLDEIWSSPEWIENSLLYLTAHPVCNECGKPSQVVHHTDPEDYPKSRFDLIGIARYMDFTRSKVKPLCNRCHDAIQKGQRICPRCKKHYIPLNDLCCYYCLTPEQKKARRDEKRAAREKRNTLRETANERNREKAQAAYRAKGKGGPGVWASDACTSNAGKEGGAKEIPE